MTPRQKRIIGLLIVGNAILFVISALFLASFSGSTSPLGLPTPVPTYRAQTAFWPACQQRLIDLLWQGGLGGTAALVDDTLQLDLVYWVPPDEHRGDVAQQVWTAFDAVVSLTNDRCESFTDVEITIEAQGVPEPTRVYADVGIADLKAFRSGELSESVFLDRVGYRIELVHDGEL